MKKTEAIATARKAVSAPIGHGTSWQIYGPYRCEDLSGPSTQANADSYWKARAKRAEWVALIALVLMGYEQVNADYSINRAIENGCTEIDKIVNYCINHQ